MEMSKNFDINEIYHCQFRSSIIRAAVEQRAASRVQRGLGTWVGLYHVALFAHLPLEQLGFMLLLLLLLFFAFPLAHGLAALRWVYKKKSANLDPKFLQPVR